MSRRRFISQFTPQRTDPEALEQILVQRHELLARSVEKLRESVLSRNKHHLLFIGARGAGKSHLVTLIHHRLKSQADLEDKLRFAWLNEDETSTSFLSLLMRIYRDLSTRYPDDFPADTLDAIRGKNPDEARQVLGAAMLHHLGKRTIVLIFENLDSLFTHLSEAEQRTWRGFIQNHPVFATAATAQSLFAGVSKREKPFFGFFDTVHLKNLSVEEAVELLEKIAELNGQPELVDFLRTPTGKARLRAVHHLSGGNPRLYIILSDFLTKEALDDLVRPFEEVVDRQLTTYYQERMRWLTPQQREIVQFLCRQGHPVPVKDIATGIFASHGSVTSQLKQLREMGYLSTHPRGREVYYELAEPLMRLSFQVKETSDRRPLELIVDFLKVWYDQKDIEKRLERFAPGAEGREYFEAALEELKVEGPRLRHQLMRREVEGIDLEKCDAHQAEMLRSLAEETGEARDWSNHADACYYLNDIAAAIPSLSRIIDMPGAPIEQVARTLFNRGICHRDVGHHAEASADFSRLIELRGAPPGDIAGALVERGVLHQVAGRLTEASADYSRVIEMPAVSPTQMAMVLINRGILHQVARRFPEAIAEYSQVIDMSAGRPDDVAGALINRGVCHRKEGRTEEAIADYSRAIDMPGTTPAPRALAFINRSESKWSTGSDTEAFEDLFSGLKLCSKDKGAAAIFTKHHGFYLRYFIRLAADLAHSPEHWPSGFIPVFSAINELKLLSALGEPLVEHLSELRGKSLDPAGLDAWVAGWEKLGGEYEEMAIPLRMLRVGVEWIKTKDEGSLLGLAKEERAVVRQALRLPPEGET